MGSMFPSRAPSIQVFEFEEISSEVGWRPRNEEIVKRQGRARGTTLFESVLKQQKIIARSSAEAELYAAALGASAAKGVESMMRDLGFAVKPVLIIDAKATEHILHRHGIGQMTHIDVAPLCCKRKSNQTG